MPLHILSLAYEIGCLRLIGFLMRAIDTGRIHHLAWLGFLPPFELSSRAIVVVGVMMIK